MGSASRSPQRGNCRWYSHLNCSHGSPQRIRFFMLPAVILSPRPSNEVACCGGCVLCLVTLEVLRLHFRSSNTFSRSAIGDFSWGSARRGPTKFCIPNCPAAKQRTCSLSLSFPNPEFQWISLCSRSSLLATEQRLGSCASVSVALTLANGPSMPSPSLLPS